MSFNPLIVFEEGLRVKPNRLRYLFIALLSVPLTVFEIWYGIAGRFTPLYLSAPFLGVLYTTTFLTISINKRVQRILWIDYLLAFLSFASCLYVLVQAEEYSNWIPGISVFSPLDTAIGVVIVLLTIELTRRCVGLGLSLVVYAGIAYLLLGDQISGMMSHRSTDFGRFIESTIISLNGGIFSGPVQVAAEYAFLFILFGRLLEHMGGGQFFYNLAASVASRRAGGVAKVSLISSGLFGMISGSPAADVMVTGPINIPNMKRVGYTGTFAAGLEAIASTGGSLVPPVMGALVFLMADFTGIPYGEICLSAIGIAFLYYMALYVHVHFRSQRMGIAGFDPDETPSVVRTLLDGWVFLLPFAVLIYMLLEGYSVGYTAAVSVVVGIVVSWFRPKGRLLPKDLAEICVSSCAAIGPLIAAVAAAGLILGILNMTGVTGKISSAIFALTGGHLFLGLVAAMVITVLLGMGMPTVAAYALAAILLAPFLIEAGMPRFVAHFFVGYYAVLSAITPPVAIAAYCAASISLESPMKVAWSALSFAAVIFALPFVFAYQPALLMLGGPLEVLLALLTTGFGVWFAAIGLEGWYRGLLPLWYRGLILAVAVCCIWPDNVLGIGAVAVGIGLIFLRRVLPGGLALTQASGK